MLPCFHNSLIYLFLPNLLISFIIKKNFNQELKKLVLELPNETQKILDLIPKLEDIKSILQKIDIQPKFEADDGSGTRTIASILKLCLDYDFYKEQGHADLRILETFRSRADIYDQSMVATLTDYLNAESENFSTNEIRPLILRRDEARGRPYARGVYADCFSRADVDHALLKSLRTTFPAIMIFFSRKNHCNESYCLRFKIIIE